MNAKANSRCATFVLNLIMVIELLIGNSVEAAATLCSQEDAIKAETKASTLRSWHAVFNSYQNYNQCDDGAVSEGYSNSIALLLANDWSRIAELTNIFAAHPKFRHFVLHHVDELMSQDQAKLIQNNATSHCPKTSSRFCAALVKRLAEIPGS